MHMERCRAGLKEISLDALDILRGDVSEALHFVMTIPDKTTANWVSPSRIQCHFLVANLSQVGVQARQATDAHVRWGCQQREYSLTGPKRR